MASRQIAAGPVLTENSGSRNPRHILIDQNHIAVPLQNICQLRIFCLVGQKQDAIKLATAEEFKIGKLPLSIILSITKKNAVAGLECDFFYCASQSSKERIRNIRDDQADHLALPKTQVASQPVRLIIQFPNRAINPGRRGFREYDIPV